MNQPVAPLNKRHAPHNVVTLQDFLEWAKTLPPGSEKAVLSFDTYCASIREVTFDGEDISFEN